MKTILHINGCLSGINKPTRINLIKSGLVCVRGTLFFSKELENWVCASCSLINYCTNLFEEEHLSFHCLGFNSSVIVNNCIICGSSVLRKLDFKKCEECSNLASNTARYQQLCAGYILNFIPTTLKFLNEQQVSKYTNLYEKK